jgi:hypothetical protein
VQCLLVQQQHFDWQKEVIVRKFIFETLNLEIVNPRRPAVTDNVGYG